MKRSLIIPILTVMASLMAVSKDTCHQQLTQPRHFMKIEVDRIDNNNSDHVSRVSCTIIGVPHTSSRVDSVTAVIKGRVYKSTDIDGIDFGRYFQWEEEGAIPVDVDIVHTRTFSTNDSIRFHTVHGTYASPLKKK